MIATSKLDENVSFIILTFEGIVICFNEEQLWKACFLIDIDEGIVICVNEEQL